WKPVSGQFTCISVGMRNNIWAVDVEGDAYYQLQDNVWVKDGKSHGFKCVNVGSDGVIWGLDLSGYLWQRAENGWRNVQGNLKSIAVGNAENIWAITVYNQVYQYTSQYGWKIVPRVRLNSITVGNDGAIWGTDSFMDVYRYAGNGKFTTESGKLRSVHTGNSNNIWGLGSDGSVW
ncbi:hypothetical protein K493DRAFT_157866, partial [Basidiobolus meristosporus CBS 931.73]